MSWPPLLDSTVHSGFDALCCQCIPYISIHGPRMSIHHNAPKVKWSLRPSSPVRSATVFWDAFLGEASDMLFIGQHSPCGCTDQWVLAIASNICIPKPRIAAYGPLHRQHRELQQPCAGVLSLFTADRQIMPHSLRLWYRGEWVPRQLQN